MLDFLGNLEPMVQVISEVLLGLVLVATAVARAMKKKKYIEDVNSIGSKVLKVIQYLPTFGINPKTKELEEAYKDARSK